MSWDGDAACLGWPPELFMVTRRGNPHPGVSESLCDRCPVQAECLADGWWDEYAVRGGATPRQRVALSTYLRAADSDAAAGMIA